MENRRTAALIREGHWSWPLWRSILTIAAIAGLILVAYRALWWGPTKVNIDTLVFLPGQLPAALVVGVSLWMLWRRQKDLAPASPPDASGSQSRPWAVPLVSALALALGLLGSGLFVWALLTGKSDLMLPSLAAHALAIAVALRGLEGLRRTILPALVLLMGVRIPKPLEDEILWRLQVWSAQGSGRLLEALGRDFIQSGVILRNDEHVFHVIDSCSGLNGILILILIALIVRELFRGAGRHRLWLLVALAPPLAFVLNVFRVAYVAASPDPEKLAGIEGDHTLQGLAVLMFGTMLLYGLGSGLSAGKRGGGSAARPPGARFSAAWTPDRSVEPIIPAIAIPWLAGLVAATWLVPRFHAPDLEAQRVNLLFPEAKRGWISEPAPHDVFFTGVFPSGLHRRYQMKDRPGALPQVVDLLIGFENASRPNATRLISSKGSLPGPEWQLEHERDARIWALDREARLALSSRRPGGEHAILYHWRIRDAGLLHETFRSLFALDVSPLHRPRPRGLVQIVAYAPHDGQFALDRAKQRLDRFTQAFREELGDPK